MVTPDNECLLSPMDINNVKDTARPLSTQLSVTVAQLLVKM